MKSRSVRAQLARAQPRVAPVSGEHRRRRIPHEVIGLGLLAVGLIIALSTFPNAGFLARYLRYALCFLVGDLGASLSAARSWIYRMNIPRCPGSRRHVRPADVNRALKEGPFTKAVPAGTPDPQPVMATKGHEDTSFD